MPEPNNPNQKREPSVFELVLRGLTLLLCTYLSAHFIMAVHLIGGH